MQKNVVKVYFIFVLLLDLFLKLQFLYSIQPCTKHIYLSMTHDDIKTITIYIYGTCKPNSYREN